MNPSLKILWILKWLDLYNWKNLACNNWLIDNMYISPLIFDTYLGLTNNMLVSICTLSINLILPLTANIRKWIFNFCLPLLKLSIELDNLNYYVKAWQSHLVDGMGTQWARKALCTGHYTGWSISYREYIVQNMRTIIVQICCNFWVTP